MIFRITLTETELQALANILDAGVRATGLKSVADAAKLLSRIDGAEQIEDSVIQTEENPVDGNADD